MADRKKTLRFHLDATDENIAKLQAVDPIGAAMLRMSRPVKERQCQTN